jgi:dolichyl-phosphate-mannose-protein mannosyltransferase
MPAAAASPGRRQRPPPAIMSQSVQAPPEIALRPIRGGAGNPAQSRRGRLLEGGLTLIVLTGALLSRLVDLDRYTGSYPEGIRAEQLLLMAHGFRPFRDIFSDQGPWLLQTLYPGYAALGDSLVGVRITVVFGSLVGLLATAWLARQSGGRWAGLLALVLVVLSPLYLLFSRIAVAELLALAPACLALGCALRHASGRGDRWILSAGVLLGVSLLIKPITLGSAPAVGLAVLLGPRRVRSGLLLAATTAAIVLLGVAAVGWNDVIQQIVQFRSASRGVEGWSLATNLVRLRQELLPEGPLLLGLAALGLVVSARQRFAWPLSIWLLGSAGLILLHAPLHSKHFSLLVPPLAALAGFGSAAVLAAGGKLRLTGSVWFRLAATILLLALAVRPGLERTAQASDFAERDGARGWYPDAIGTLARVTPADSFVVTDHAYLAWAAERLIPPGLVEASATRVRAGSLTDALAIEQTRQYDSSAVLLWADKLIDLKRYRAWLTERYVPIKIWAVEGDTRPVLWLRSDLLTEATRDALRFGYRRPIPAIDFGGWQLAGFRTWTSSGTLSLTDEKLNCPGNSILVGLELTADAGAPRDAQVALSLIDDKGAVVEDEREPLLGSVGRSDWLVWVSEVPLPRQRPAMVSYSLLVELQDGRGHSLGRPVQIGGARIMSC